MRSLGVSHKDHLLSSRCHLPPFLRVLIMDICRTSKYAKVSEIRLLFSKLMLRGLLPVAARWDTICEVRGGFKGWDPEDLGQFGVN